MSGFASNKPSGNSDWQESDVRKWGFIIFCSADEPALASTTSSSSSLAPSHVSLVSPWPMAARMLGSAWPPFPDQPKVAGRAQQHAAMAYVIPSENIQGWKSLFSELAELEPEQKY